METSPLSQQIGYRNSPRNRSTTTIHTKEQLDSILHANSEPKIERSFILKASGDMDMHSYEVGTIESPYLKRDSSLVDEIKAFTSSSSSPQSRYDNEGDSTPDGLFLRRRRDSSSSRKSFSDTSDFRSVSPLFDDRSLNLTRKEPSSIFDEHQENLTAKSFKLIWLCNTVLRPLITKIDELNSNFARSSPPIQLKLGETSLENILGLLSSKMELCSSVLPLVLPYLRLCSNQNYLVARIRELASDVTMKEFKWNSGGREHVRDVSGSIRIAPWHDGLPTDTDLIWNLFCVYMDSILSASPFIVNHAKKPFTNISEKPPLFEFVTDGGRNTHAVSKDVSNLFQTMILFIAHCKEKNKSRIDHMNLDHTGLNLIEIIS